MFVLRSRDSWQDCFTSRCSNIPHHRPPHCPTGIFPPLSVAQLSPHLSQYLVMKWLRTDLRSSSPPPRSYHCLCCCGLALLRFSLLLWFVFLCSWLGSRWKAAFIHILSGCLGAIYLNLNKELVDERVWHGAKTYERQINLSSQSYR